MTTPEKLRARQRREGFFIILIGFGMLFQTYHNDREDSKQDACFSAYTKANNEVQQYRSDLATVQNKAQRDYDLGLINESKYKEITKDVANKRASRPFPEYPDHGCK